LKEDMYVKHEKDRFYNVSAKINSEKYAFLTPAAKSRFSTADKQRKIVSRLVREILLRDGFEKPTRIL